MKKKQPTTGSNLSAREIECLKLASNGLSNIDIALALGISRHTVHTYFRNISMRLQSSDKTSSCCFAIREGIIK